jgi:hypothetical protein
MTLKIDCIPIASIQTTCISCSLAQQTKLLEFWPHISITPQWAGAFWVISMQMCISMHDPRQAFSSPAEELILLGGLRRCVFHLDMLVWLWTHRVNSISAAIDKEPHVKWDMSAQPVKISGLPLVCEGWKMRAFQGILTLSSSVFHVVMRGFGGYPNISCVWGVYQIMPGQLPESFFSCSEECSVMASFGRLVCQWKALFKTDRSLFNKTKTLGDRGTQ